MNEWKYTNEDNTGVMKISTGGSCLEGTNTMWQEFQNYLANGGQVDPWKTEQELKEEAHSSTLAGIEAKKEEENLKDFVYNGNTYLSDKPSIQATQNEALAGLGTDSIHTLVGTPYEGMWAAVGTFVPFTNAEFLLFATEFFKRGSDNFTTRSVHKMNIGAILADPTTTAEDILAYDYSTGWH